MTKEWICTNCGETETKALLPSLREGGPSECENCGNDEFKEEVVGSVHPIVDDLVS